MIKACDMYEMYQKVIICKPQCYRKECLSNTATCQFLKVLETVPVHTQWHLLLFGSGYSSASASSLMSTWLACSAYIFSDMEYADANLVSSL